MKKKKQYQNRADINLKYNSMFNAIIKMAKPFLKKKL